MSNEANSLLEKSLQNFGERFEALLDGHFEELKPIGSVLKIIDPRGSSEPGAFVRNLIDFSSAIIEVRNLVDFASAAEIRKNPVAALGELPVPPYDMWLPFKAEDVTPNPPEGLGEAIRIFDERIRDLAAKWQRKEEQTRPKIDAELFEFCTKMGEQYDDCNNCCFTATQKRMLFTPLSQDYNALFPRLICLPVRNRQEFGSFILALYRVFEEGLEADIRKWKEGVQLMGPFIDVARVLNGDFPMILNQLRISVVHGRHDDKAAALELALAFEKLISEKTIAPDDAPAWLNLQKTVLRKQSEVLKQVAQAFRSYSK
jgi:hypothetical protein